MADSGMDTSLKFPDPGQSLACFFLLPVKGLNEGELCFVRSRDLLK